MLSDYNMTEGGVMVFGLLFMLLALALAAKVRGFDEHSATSHFIKDL